MSWSYRLHALEGFSCLAAECPRSCCEQWSIPLDKPILERWQALPEDERSALFDHIDELDGVSYLGKQGNQCFAVNEQGLCSIQQKYGHDMIPVLCRDFPRMSRSSPVMEISSARLSCPVITQAVYSAKADAVLFMVSRTQGSATSDAYLFMDALQTTADRIMSELRSPLDVRIMVLLKTFDRINQLVQQDRFNQASHKQIMKELRQSMMVTKNRLASMRRAPVSTDETKAWGCFYQSLMAAGFDRAMLPESLKDGISDQSLAEVKQVILHNRLEPDVKTSIDRILQRFFQVMLVNEGFPGHPIENHYFLALIKPAILYLILRMLLIAKALEGGEIEGYAEEVTVELTRRLTESYALGDILACDDVLRSVEIYSSLMASMSPG